MKFIRYLNEEVITESNTMSVSEFIKNLENAVKKIFPKSFVKINASTNLGSSIHMVFALGKDRSEWINGIIENDPLFHRFMIGWNSFQEDTFIKDKIVAELSVGGNLKILPDEGSHLAQGRIKIGWRKKTAPPDKIIQHFTNYFKKVKKTLIDNKDKLFADDAELMKKKI